MPSINSYATANFAAGNFFLGTDGSGNVKRFLADSPAFTTQITTPAIIGGTTASSTLTLESTSGAGTTDAILFKTASQSERARFTSAGAFLINTTVTRTMIGQTAKFTCVQDSGALGICALAVGADPNPAVFILAKTRNSSLSSHTVVNSGDTVGSIYFSGDDGTADVACAAITADVNGTPGTNDMPGRLKFQTTLDGASTPSTRLSIDNAGNCAVVNGTLGYGTGVGGTVTQITNKSTGVTLNKICGQIVTNNAATTAQTTFSFVVSNTTIAATDTVVLNHASGGTATGYIFWVDRIVGGTSFAINCFPLVSESQALTLNFSIIKAVTS